MSRSSPADLAVLACPGGEVFADEVIFHLKQYYRHKFNKTVAVLAKKYSMDTGTVIRRINFLNDAGAVVENMPGTGGTLLKAMRFLREQGSGKVICAVSLPMFSGKAIEHFDNAYSEGLSYRIIGTNAIYQEELLKREWYISVNIAKLFARTISRLHQGQSLSSLPDNREIIEKLLAVT